MSDTNEITQLEQQIKEMERKLETLKTAEGLTRLKSFEGKFYQNGSVYLSFQKITVSGLKALSFCSAVEDGWYRRGFRDEEDVQSFTEYAQEITKAEWDEAQNDFWKRAQTTLECAVSD